MPIRMASGMRKKLPEHERENVEQALWDKSGGRCFLCEELMNRAADDLEVDHDVPESEGGPTELANLNIAHRTCNRAKRNAKTIPIRPYLKLAAYVRKEGSRVKYDGLLKHFGIVPKPSFVSIKNGRVDIELPDGSSASVPVFRETNGAGTFEYVFLEVPRNAIFNDAGVQPRVVQPAHVWAIYADLQTNALHEPPGCRLEHTNYDQPVRCLMFDGQHKTVANWMMGRDRITVKLYLNLSTEAATQLVNSIQARIKKLPLSPFERAAKMADEFQQRFSEYEESVGTTEVSEEGFVSWLPQADRSRGKNALESAILQTILSDPDLRIHKYVKYAGMDAPPWAFNESTLKTRVLDKLIMKKQLKQKGEEGIKLRDQEAANIVTCLNTLTDLSFEPQGEANELTEREQERARRIAYQASLEYISNLIRQLFGYVQMKTGNPMMSGELTDEQWEKLNQGIERLIDHPVWTADFKRDASMQKLQNALQKNQGASEAFEELALDLPYLLVGPEAPGYKKKWAAVNE